MNQKKIALATSIAVAIAAPAEGLRHLVYRDPVGVLTYCYGETQRPEVGRVYTTEECKALLSDRMLEAVEQVERCVPGLPANVVAAFGDAVYNLGPTIACNEDASTAARFLQAGDIVAACKQLPRWNKARVAGVLIPFPGLTKRRDIEMEVCLS